MGTVRYTSTTPAPPSSGKKAKRKAGAAAKARAAIVRAFNLHAADPDDLSVAHALAQDMLDEKLASRDKWQVCTQRNLSAIRAECMAVRRELTHVEETIDTVQMQVEDGLAGYSSRREEIDRFVAEQREKMKAFWGKMEASEKLALEHKETTQRQLVKINKRLESHFEKHQQKLETAIDEDSLLTQLAGLQERFESEIGGTKNDVAKMLDDKLRNVTEEMTSKMAALEDLVRRRTENEQKVDFRPSPNSSQLPDDLQQLVHRIAELERNSDRLRADNQQLIAMLDTSRKQSEGFDDRIRQMSREIDRQAHTLRSFSPPHMHHRPSSPLPSHLSPPLPPPVNLGPIEQKLHFVMKDLHFMVEDFSRWKNHADAHRHSLRQEMAARIDDVRKSLFAALSNDSQNHAFENRRLKDAVFELRGDMTDLRKNLGFVHHELKQELTELSRRSQSLPLSRPHLRTPESERSFRRYDRDFTPPYRQSAFETLDAEEAYFGRGSGNRGRENNRSRSRSRSPLNRAHARPSRSRSRSPRGGRRPPSVSTEMIYRPLNRELSFSPPRSGRSTASTPRQQASTSAPEGRPFPRVARRPARCHEVIVIEDGEEEGEERESVQESSISQDAPHMAPPDRVLDEAEEEATVTVAEPDAEAEESSSVTSTGANVEIDCEVADLRVGLILLLCSGGAPTFDMHWNPLHPALPAGDCVKAAELLQFEAQYPIIPAFPLGLDQFVVKAALMRREGMTDLKDGDDSFSLEQCKLELVRDEFAVMLSSVRDKWNKTSFEMLSDAVKRLPEGDETSSAAVLSSSPTASNESITSVEFLKRYSQWAESHSRILARLVRSLKKQTTIEADETWQVIDKIRASPSVFVFLSLFDVVHLGDEVSLRARFRMSSFGKELFAKLWETLINKLPPGVVIECSWLDDMLSPPKKIPVAGMAHVLSAILLPWSPRSLQQHSSGKLSEIIAQSTQKLTEMVRVNGKPLSEFKFGECPLIELGDESQPLELEVSGFDWLSLLDLDCFADVLRQGAGKLAV